MVTDTYRSLTLAVFDTGSRDKMQLAEMSVLGRISDITKAEEETKKELSDYGRLHVLKAKTVAKPLWKTYPFSEISMQRRQT